MAQPSAERSGQNQLGCREARCAGEQRKISSAFPLIFFASTHLAEAYSQARRALAYARRIGMSSLTRRCLKTLVSIQSLKVPFTFLITALSSQAMCAHGSGDAAARAEALRDLAQLDVTSTI